MRGHENMASGKRPRFSRLSESAPDSHGGGADGITGGRAAGSGSGEARGDRLDLSMVSGKFRRFSRLFESPPHSHGGGGDGITGGRAAGSGSGEVRGDRLNRSDQIARRDPYPLLPGHGFGFKKEKSADCHDGCVPKEVHERVLECVLEIEDFMAHFRDSCKRNVSCTSDRSKGEQQELLYGSLLSYHWGRKSGGGREPAGRFPYASSSSYAGPSADFRAPPVPLSHAPRARDIRKRSGSPTRGALPPKDYGGDLKMKSHAPRARDIRKRSGSPTRGALPPKDYGGDLKMKRGRDDRHGPV